MIGQDKVIVIIALLFIICVMPFPIGLLSYKFKSEKLKAEALKKEKEEKEENVEAKEKVENIVEQSEKSKKDKM